MRISRSNLLSLNPSENETITLDPMAKRDWHRRETEGTGGDSESSMEEISADDFKQGVGSESGRSRGVWMNYRMPRDYAQRLSSFAWAQAVQNKPLGLDLMPMTAGDLAKGGDVKDVEENSVFEVSSEVGGEKEDGEIEEGEIEFGSEPGLVESNIEVVDVSESKNDDSELDTKEGLAEMETESENMSELDKLVGFILEELDTITVEEAKASFDAVCSKLHKCFENLKTMCTGVESADSVVIALVQQAFEGIQTVYSAINSKNSNNKQNEKDLLLRMLIRIKNQYSSLLTPEQVQEIDDLLKSLVFQDDNKEKEKSLRLGNGNRQSSNSDFSSATERYTKNSLGPSGMGGLTKLSIQSPGAGFSPLLDLHAEHDEGNLPSPTRDNPVQFPARKPIGYGITKSAVSFQPEISKKAEAETEKNQHYVTEALKAVSSYEQKYGKVSFPESPTPSEERNVENDDLYAEISSSTITCNGKAPNTLSQCQVGKNFSGSNTIAKSSDSGQIGPVKHVEQLGLGTKSTTKPLSKSRDPRLRFLKPEISGASDSPKREVGGPESRNVGLVAGSLNNKKHKALNDTGMEDYASKRQRNDFSSSRELQVQSGRGGWLEDASHDNSQQINVIRLNEIDGRKPGVTGLAADRGTPVNNDYVAVNGSSQQNPSYTPAASVSLPSLLKAVNPTILMQLFQMEKQRLAEGKQQQSPSLQSSTNTSISSVLPGAVSSVTNNYVQPNGVGINAAGSQIPAQATSLSSENNGGRRMKARDPRRILQNNTQKSEIIDCEQIKSRASSPDTLRNTNGIGPLREQLDLVQNIPSQSIPRPEFNGQLPRNLKHLAGTVSTWQRTTVTTSHSLPQTNQSVTGQIVQTEVNPTFANSNELKNISIGASQGATVANLQPANSWGDVHHLLDGYDDEQKATIQRERARRIDEQNKMFAARKLCLVLDLDHTLLNSAKFGEVDPIHEEILRKKEDIDKEKPLRHLFRFQHMSMWTKLRPGVWNFLEKASKLFEMHLYTMGNKLYATEMAKVLDPTGKLFSGRVLSRGDDTDSLDGDERVPKIKDLEGVLGMESAVLIIDDSVRVWPHNKHNLIVVERYTFFPCSRRQFGLPGPSLLEIDHDERPEDGTLASALSVIERIHQTFFSHALLNELDVRNILAAEKRKILAGCKIVFSRIIPVGDINPHLHPLWQLAEQFGAVCTNQCDDTVTHVVANSLGTDKVNWAFNNKKFVVSPGWLEATAVLYRRANEIDFAVTQLP